MAEFPGDGDSALFITAEHVGETSAIRSLNGVTYNTIASYDDPNSDLQVWKVMGFPELGRAVQEGPRRRAQW